MTIAYPLHAMIDLETLGTAPGAAILTIAALTFRPELLTKSNGGWLWWRWEQAVSSVKVHVDLQSCLDAGLSINPGTLKWWMSQNESARRDAFSLDAKAVSIREACETIRSFLVEAHPTEDGQTGCRIWAHGANFDPPILAHAMNATGVKLPWHYRAIRDTRTILELAGITHEGLAHEPVRDCTEQAMAVSRAMFLLPNVNQAVAA